MVRSIDENDVIDSLRPGDGIIRRRPAIFGLLGFCFLAMASMKPPRMPSVDEVMILISNPVAHGAVQAEMIMNTISELPFSVVTDLEHSRLSTDAQINFPTTSPKSLFAFGIGSALIKAIRVRAKLDLSTLVNPNKSWIYREYLVLAQCVRYVLAEQLWSLHTNVKLVITDYDRHVYSRPLLDVARKLGIPTVTTLHGSPSMSTYLPIRAETVFAWGTAQQQWLRNESPGTRVFVIGRPTVNAKLYSNSSAPRLIVLNSLEILSLHEADKIVELIAARRALNHQTIVRLHPKCRISDVEQPSWRRVLDAVDSVVHSDGELNDFLSQKDIVCGIGSTGLIDALMMDIPVICMADSDRILPVDLRFLLDHQHVAAQQVRDAIVRAAGDDFIVNAKKALSRILAD